MLRIFRWLRYFLYALNGLAALALLLSLLATRVSPTDFWLLALFGLGYPMVLLVNAFFLLYWLIRWKRFALVSLVVLLLGIPQLVSFLRFKVPTPPYQGPRDITLLSYNVDRFHLYSWADTPPTMDSVKNLAEQLKANVICLQEFFTNSTTFTDLDARILFPANAHIHYVVDSPQNHYGLATFSTFPIVASGEIHFAGSANATIFTDLAIGNDTIRVYNNHLQSYRLKNQNLEFVRNPDFSKKARPWQRILSIIRQLKKGILQRAQQVQLVRAHIENSPYPVIVCGDFNDAPTSYAYRQMRKGLLDAFITTGDGFGSTYRNIFPSFRIDYVLYSPTLRALDYEVPTIAYSDHFPVTVPFELDAKTSTTTTEP